MINKRITNIEVKKSNRNRIFRYICKHDRVSNPDIAYELNISLPTVTQNTKDLIQEGLIREEGELQSTGGRRAKAVSVIGDCRLAAGLDITKNHISLLLTDMKGSLLNYRRIHYPFCQADRYYQEVSQKLEQFLEESAADRGRILGIGISFPGIVDLKQNMVSYSHILGIESVPFSTVSRFFSYPCHFLNDANAGAYAEGICSETAERFFYLSLSNTVGGAVFGSRELVQGKNFRCGEVGHMTIVPEGERCYCGKAGCLDAYCSAKRLADLTEGKLERFFDLLEEQDRAALEMWDRYTTYLAVAINNIHMVLDCDVILGGYVGSLLEPYIQDIRRKVEQRATFAEDGAYIRTCNYKIEAAALGAAQKVIESFIEQV